MGTQLRLNPTHFLNELILGDLRTQFLVTFTAVIIKAGTMDFQAQHRWDLSKSTMDLMERLIKLVMLGNGHWTGMRQLTTLILMDTAWFGVDLGEPYRLG